MDPTDLRAQAHAATRHAHAPHSGLAVGAVLADRDGRTVSGANLETPSWTVSVHAEVAAVILWNNQRVVGPPARLVCVDGNGDPVPPCGQCRQALFDLFGGTLLVDTTSGWVTLESLLPYAFTAERLPDYAREER